MVSASPSGRGSKSCWTSSLRTSAKDLWAQEAGSPDAWPSTMALKSSRPVRWVSTVCSRMMASCSCACSVASLDLAFRSARVAFSAKGDALSMYARHRLAQGSFPRSCRLSTMPSTVEDPKHSRTFFTNCTTSSRYSAFAGAKVSPFGITEISSWVTKGSRFLSLGLTTADSMDKALRTTESMSSFDCTWPAACPSIEAVVDTCSSKVVKSSMSLRTCDASGGLLPTISSISSSSMGCPDTQMYLAMALSSLCTLLSLGSRCVKPPKGTSPCSGSFIRNTVPLRIAR
mmetsp:Transcript_9447/g.35373  ORF Transcript_9447/g.35373 Transcript_9447/m.35373 type:complete len:287 (+) Transcript_9447:239-1099(+)